MAAGLIHEKIWMDKSKYDDAERQHFEGLAKLPKAAKGCPKEIDFNPLPSPPETPGSQPRKTKVTKSRLQDYASVLDLCDFKEKTNKKSKKAREANRQREMMLDSISNKELPPSPAREEPLPLAHASPAAPAAPAARAPSATPAARAPSATPAAPTTRAPSTTPAPVPVPEAPKQAKKEPNQKLSKAEKKRANKREKEEAAAAPKVDEKPAAVEKTPAAAPVSAVSAPVAKSDVAQGGSSQVCSVQGSSLASEVAKARQHIKNSLEWMDTVLASVHSEEVVNRISSLETALQDLRKLMIGIQGEVRSLAERIPATSALAPAVCPMPAKAPKAPAVVAPKEDSDDGVDLFASDSDGEDDDAAAKIREERLANYAAKKSTKPVLIAKSNIILDVKPWDDETDMKVLEEKVRLIVCDGLLWGASKLVTLAYGIQKLQISCVVEDDKVSIDWLQEEIEKNEDYVQSVDIAAFNKV